MAKRTECVQELPTWEIITRWELERVAWVYPEGHPDYPEGYQETWVENILRSIESHGFWPGRRTVGLIYFGCNSEKGVLWLDAYTSEAGMVSQEAWKYLTEEEKDAVWEEISKCLMAESLWGLPEGTLVYRS